MSKLPTIDEMVDEIEARVETDPVRAKHNKMLVELYRRRQQRDIEAMLRWFERMREMK